MVLFAGLYTKTHFALGKSVQDPVSDKNKNINIIYVGLSWHDSLSNYRILTLIFGIFFNTTLLDE